MDFLKIEKEGKNLTFYEIKATKFIEWIRFIGKKNQLKNKTKLLKSLSNLSNYCEE